MCTIMNEIHVHAHAYTQNKTIQMDVVSIKQAEYSHTTLAVSWNKGPGMYWTANRPQSQWKAFVEYLAVASQVQYEVGGLAMYAYNVA